MMKRVLICSVLALAAMDAMTADVKVTELPVTDPALTDEFPFVSDPAGSPVTSKTNVHGLVRSMWSTNESDFTIAVFPDTQSQTGSTSGSDSNDFFNACQHLLTNATALNLKAVIGLGDIVQLGNVQQEWTNAYVGYGKLFSNSIPVFLAQGNHDLDDQGVTAGLERWVTNYNSWFGTNYLFPKSWWNGDIYGSGASNHVENAYFLLTNGPSVYGFMNLEFGPRTNVLDWASNIVESLPLVKWFITTHSYMYRDDSRVGGTDLFSPHVYACCTNGADGEGVWQYFVREHPNIFTVMSGHDLADGQGRLASRGKFNNVVSQYLFNYQLGTDDNGVSASFELLTFRPTKGIVEVRTYSPVTDTYNTEATYEFGFPLQLVDNQATAGAASGRYREEFFWAAANQWTAAIANSGSASWGVTPASGAADFGWVGVFAGSVSNGASLIRTANTAGFFGSQTLQLDIRLETATLSDSDNLHTTVVGFGDSTVAGTEPVDGAYFIWTDTIFGGNWAAKTRNNSTDTWATNGIAVAVSGGAVWDLRIIGTSDEVDFYVSADRGTTFTQIGSSTSNIPSSSARVFGVQAYNVKQGGAVGTTFRGIYIDRIIFPGD